MLKFITLALRKSYTMKKFNLFLLLFTIAFSGFSQEILMPAGGTAAGSGGSVSFSVGQTFFHTWEQTGWIISEGVQQPHEILIPIGIEEKEMTFKVYPNPASTRIKVINDHQYPGPLSWKLSDLAGNEKNQGKIIDDETIIRIDEYPSGTYILSIFQNDDPILHHKIIIQ